MGMFNLQTIHNFRDLGESIPPHNDRRLFCNLFFRSATLDFASQEELDVLVKDCQVKTILDLRSELEAKLAELGRPFTTFPITASLKLDPADILNPDPRPEKVKVVKKAKSNPDGTSLPSRKTIMVNFAGTKFRKGAVWWPAPWWCKFKIVGLVITGNKLSAARVAGVEVLNKKGLEGLYRDFIDFCDQEINEGLHILANPSNYPVLVHCTHGKDRTGIIVALALAAVGVDEDHIIADYAKSTEGLRQVHPKMVEELSVNGLDPCFADTPAQCMRNTFEYIKTKFGSVNEYLDAIGFGEQARELLKTILVDERNGFSEKYNSDSSQRTAYSQISDSSQNSPEWILSDV